MNPSLRWRAARLLAIGCLALAACTLAPPAPVAYADSTLPPGVEPLQRFPMTIVRIQSAAGVHEFRAWVADTPARRAQGLMFVKRLDADRAMFFPMGPPQVVSFWMKNTYISLDLLFVDADGRVVNVAANATPLSLEPITAAAPVVAVLEVAAGTATRLRIRPGDQLLLLPPGQR